MSDPYRTPAVVETDEQRLERLHDAYYQMGMVDASAIRRLPPDKRKAWEASYRQAERAYFDALNKSPHLAQLPAMSWGDFARMLGLG